MTSALIIGVALGLRHALEADHVAAVAAMATGVSTPRAAALRGAMWGVGHTLTLLVFGGAIIALGIHIPAAAERAFEALVGVMLVAIGIDTVRNLRRLHVHAHVHDDGGPAHIHIHAHDSPEEPHREHAASDHRHAHASMGSLRALGIGMVHGLAGSAALVVLTAETLSSTGSGLVFIGLFGLGSIVGMTAMSILLALPVQLSARYTRRHVPKVLLVAGTASIVVGIHLIISMTLA